MAEEVTLQMSVDNYEVKSEIHEGSVVDSSAKPQLCVKNVVTNFAFRLPSHIFPGRTAQSRCEVDDDGDLIVHRLHDTNDKRYVIAIEQSCSTPLELVGLQVWRGALALADFILHERSAVLNNQTILELGSGTGLTGIVAAMFAQEIICTDVDVGNILELIKANFSRNDKYIKAKYSVLGLDFYARQWSNCLETKLTEVSVVLVADVVYDNDLTDAFVKTLQKILSVPPKKTAYIALEKRYVFTVADLDCVAPCYEHFLQCLQEAQGTAGSCWHIEQIPLDFPQYFINYERVKELVLIKINFF